MLYGLKLVRSFAPALLAGLTAAAQTGPVALTSPNGALEISIATVRGQSVQAAGGQLAYRVTFRGRPVLQWSNLGLAIEGSPALGAAATQPKDSGFEKRRVNAQTVVKLQLAPGGGCAIRLVPVR